MPLRENGFLLEGEFCQAILDALESRAALLDQNGTLIAVSAGSGNEDDPARLRIAEVAVHRDGTIYVSVSSRHQVVVLR